MLAFLLLIILGVSKLCNGFISNHSFVFITGWPQSGTSLIQQFMTSCPNLSTMTEKCEELLGKRCVNWNHEGQWLLRGTTRQFFSSGAMCPSNTNGLTELQKTTVMDEWRQFWSLDKQYLAEKSPQSMLKTAMLRQLAEGSQNIRILIILKNPVTLNIATPKNAGWKYFRGEPTSSQTPSSSSSDGKKMVNIDQSSATMDHFIDFMIHDRSRNNSGADCSLGWLPAMDTLHRQLLNDSNSVRDIRIVRYEQFERPNPLCRAIFAFVLNSNNSSEFNRTVAQVCDVFFPSTTLLRSSASTHSDSNRVGIRGNVITTHSSRTKSGGVTSNRVSASHHHRQLLDSEISIGNEMNQSVARVLRLRNYQDTKSFSFIPDLVTTAGQERVHDFLFATQRNSRIQQRVVDDIEHRLNAFGYNLYSLREWRKKKNQKTNLFSPWEFDV